MQSQMVLQTSERLAILVASNLDTNESRDAIIRDNIGNHINYSHHSKLNLLTLCVVITVEQRDASDNNDVIFPSQELLNEAESSFSTLPSASIRLPASLIQSRGL